MMRGVAVAVCLAAGLTTGAAQAHAMPGSTMILHPIPAGFEATVSIPVSELQAALGAGVTTDGAGREVLERYVRAHIAITGLDGRTWPMNVKDLQLRDGEPPVLALAMAFARPPGAAPQKAHLRYDAVNHRVASHYVLVYLRGADPEGPLTPWGRLQFPFADLPLDPGGR